MTKKEVQESMNDCVLSYINRINEIGIDGKGERLRTCKAKVFSIPGFKILQSYNTFVAAIDLENDMLIDFLRFTYGFTNTSAQHIAKFSKDYGQGKWGCTNRIVYRPI